MEEVTIHNMYWKQGQSNNLKGSVFSIFVNYYIKNNLMRFKIRFDRASIYYSFRPIVKTQWLKSIHFDGNHLYSLHLFSICLQKCYTSNYCNSHRWISENSPATLSKIYPQLCRNSTWQQFVRLVPLPAAVQHSYAHPIPARTRQWCDKWHCTRAAYLNGSSPGYREVSAHHPALYKRSCTYSDRADSSTDMEIRTICRDDRKIICWSDPGRPM